MAMYSIHSVQQFSVSAEELWNFISDPKNLKVITPPEMRFITRSGDDRKMFAGQIIHYSVRPFWGLTLEWVTEITHVADKNYFVDEQRHGPYAFWHHKHFVRETPDGSEMEDIVHYRLPFGPVGQLFHWLVRSKLEKIFAFRANKLNELFGS